MIRILSIDGGGVRGIIPARILQNIENDLGINIYNYFDVFAGSSVGSMIIGAIVYKQASGNQLVEKYINVDNIKKIMPTNYAYVGLILISLFIIVLSIFLGYKQVPTVVCGSAVTVSMLGAFFGLIMGLIITSVISLPILYSTPKFPGGPKTKLIESFIGEDTQLNNTSKKVFITAYNMSSHLPTFFRSWESNTYLVKDVIDASTAAPGLYPAVKIQRHLYIDGGAVANNPTDCVYGEIVSKYRLENDNNTPIIKILSLGCGRAIAPKCPENCPDNITNWGILRWVTSGKVGLFIGNEQTVDTTVRNFAGALDDTYVRIDGELENTSLDDTSNLERMYEIADRWYSDNKDSLISFFA